jgi:preprotein translocase subunit SecA
MRRAIVAQVRQMGGLLVLSTNFQESKRIENQLKGRAGRQVHTRRNAMRSASPAQGHAV